jgi:putative SOS response-associated peptidase YedK
VVDFFLIDDSFFEFMCGRYVSPEEAAIEREWNRVRIRNPLGLDRTNWNVAPTHQVPALRRVGRDAEAGGTEGGVELVALRWGLIPSWAKGVAPKFGTIMATCERLASAPTWRGPWRGGKNGGQRCILPARGFYRV